MEQWKDIKGYKGIYQVSNMGRVKSLPCTKLFKSKNQYGLFTTKRKYKGKILKPILQKDGYLSIMLVNKHGKKHIYKVHRLVLRAFNPTEYNKYPQINHKNEIRTDNRLSNLEGCTAKYNDNYGNRNKRLSLNNSNPLILIKGKQKRYFSCRYNAEKYLKNKLKLKTKLSYIGSNINHVRYSHNAHLAYGYEVKFL